MGKKRGIRSRRSNLDRKMKMWTNGTLIEGRKTIDSLNFVMHYGSPCVWEGIRSYKQVDGSTSIFMLEEHIDRLFDSAKIVDIEIPYSKEQLIRACNLVVKQNGNEELYLRPVAYAKNDAESAKPQDMEIVVDIYAFPLKPLHDKPVKCIISSYIRGYPQYQMQAKTTENYTFLQKVKPELKATGADEALLTDSRGYIVEATVANLFVVKGDVVMTPPNDGSILPGITRRCLGTILTSPSIMMPYAKSPILLEKPITRADLYTADCVILCGTYAEVVRVAEIDGRTIGNPSTWKYYEILSEEYRKWVRGEK